MSDHTDFDNDLLILLQEHGPWLPATAALRITRALRGAVLKYSGTQPPPEWATGHEASGPRSEDEAGHLAFVPLPFVGAQQADGNVLAVALAFPRAVDQEARRSVVAPLLVCSDGQPRAVALTMGTLGVVRLRMAECPDRPTSVQPVSWTAHPRGACTWASATPVVLDRFPKSDRARSRPQWTQEVGQIVAAACTRIGLPAPQAVDVDTTSWHRGAPPAVARPARGGPAGNAACGEATVDGFPRYPSRGTNAPRPQFHVRVRFAKPVVGPVLLGAGRYQGYGVCKPLSGQRA